MLLRVPSKASKKEELDPRQLGEELQHHYVRADNYRIVIRAIGHCLSRDQSRDRDGLLWDEQRRAEARDLLALERSKNVRAGSCGPFSRPGSRSVGSDLDDCGARFPHGRL
jgi:hypothetical protein